MNGSQPGLISEKAKIVLPIAASVIALFVFMILVWPKTHHDGKQGKQGRSDRIAKVDGRTNASRGDDSRGAGWRPESTERGTHRNSQVTDDGAGPATSGKEARARSAAPKGETWWYHEDGTMDHSSAKGGWWYH